MDKNVLDFVVEKTKDLMKAPSASDTSKKDAQTWLNAVGTADEAKATKTYIAALEQDICTIDELIALAQSDMGTKIFGADTAKKVAAHAKQIKADGALFCDCPACAAIEAILKKKKEILA